jgi:hypothetical protein
MIEREAQIRIYSEILANQPGAKMARGRLVRVWPEGFYEVQLDSQGRLFTTLLPVASTVILSEKPEDILESIEIDRHR